MYEEFFGLAERPFSIAPDPQYLYMSQSHKEAMAHLSYGLSQGGGFIVLTGEVGTGKTTLCRTLLQDLPENTDVALILNANLDESELLQTLCDELKVEYSESDSQKKLLDRINTRLLDSFGRNRQTVLIIDEAQLLSRNVLEQIRLLTNLETTKTKLLKIILIGQPELNDILRREDLRQLAQRVTARYHLGALKDNDVELYLNTRLSVAGCKQPVFTRQAIDQLRKATDGIPRRINVLADHCMLTAYAKSSRWVDASMVRAAALDVLLPSGKPALSRLGRFFALSKARWWLLAGTLLLFNALMWWLMVGDTPAWLQAKTSADQQSSVLLTTANDVQVSGSAATPSEPVSDEGKPDSKLVAGVDESTLDRAGVAPSESTKPSAPGNVMTSSVYLDDTDAIPDEAFLQETPKQSAVVAADVPLSGSADLIAPTWFTGDDFNAQQLFDLLTTSTNVTTRNAAFQRLAGLWDYHFEEPVLAPYCQLLGDAGLACLDVDNWAELIAFNRPSIVVLSADGIQHRAIVRSIAGSRVNLLVGSRAIVVDQSVFESLWTGNAVAIWRYNGFDGHVWAMGDSGDAVLLAKQRIDLALRRLQSEPLLDPNSAQFDADTAQKLMALQNRYGLSVDGEFGMQTKLLINELLSETGVPRLVDRPL